MHKERDWCTVKILVLSDSHSGRIFMRHCIDTVKPDHIIHLGDHYEDGTVIAEEYPHLRVHQVPGNCDFGGAAQSEPPVMCYDIGGVRIFMTHGHMHGVKSGLDRLISAAAEMSAQVITFGHTHEALCFQTETGVWVMNPGSCRSWSGSAGVIEIVDKKVSACYVIKQAELELMQEQG